MPGTTLTQAARCASTRPRAIFSASTVLDAVLNTTILSVIFDFCAAESFFDGTILFSGASMRSRGTKISYAVAVLVAASYALVTLRDGIPALIQRQSEIRALEKQNADLNRDIE